MTCRAWQCHCCDPFPTLLGLPIKVWSPGWWSHVVGTAFTSLKKGGKLPKAQWFLQEHPAGGGHRQTQALVILHNQVILKTRVSLLAPWHLSLFLLWFDAPHSTGCLRSPTSPPKTTLKALETAKVSPKVRRQLMGWGLLGQWETGKDAQKLPEAGAGTVAVGRIPTVLPYLGCCCLCHPRKSSGSVDHSQLFSPENS